MNNSSKHKLSDLLQDQREEIIAIAAKHGAFNVRVFGSVARNEADQDSDIDFLVDYSLDDIISSSDEQLNLTKHAKIISYYRSILQ